MVDRKGFDAQTWKTTKAFNGRCATPQDVEVGGAVFALADTHHGHPIDMALPSPVIWYEEDEEFAALAVQAAGRRGCAPDAGRRSRAAPQPSPPCVNASARASP